MTILLSVKWPPTIGKLYVKIPGKSRQKSGSNDFSRRCTPSYIKSAFYGDLVYKFRKIYACNDFNTQLRKIILGYIKIGYNINVIQQTACMVVNPITVNDFASLFGCTPAGRASDSDGSGLKTFK